jgi:hypothetical protein
MIASELELLIATKKLQFAIASEKEATSYKQQVM